MFLIDRRFFRAFDWTSFLIIFIISCISLLFVFSTTTKPELVFSVFFKKQLFGVISGLCIFFLCATNDYRPFLRWGYFLYFGVIALLIFTIIKGHIGMGGQRWVDFGFFKAQPSELTKFFFPLFATYYFQTQRDNFDYTFKDFIPVLGIILVSILLIRKQPDLGTALVFAFSALIMLWLIGMNKKFFIYLFLATAIMSPIIWKTLRPYQKKRITVFLGEGDRQKERYQLEQSKIAIGSGGFLGKGFLKGTQNTLRFLPESRTDFIFSVIGEEWGFIGSFLVILLYAVLFIRALLIIPTIQSIFAQFLAASLIIQIIMSACINMLMVIGFLPIVGIPLPLLSYGISSLWITFANLGLFNAIAVRRYYIGE